MSKWTLDIETQSQYGNKTALCSTKQRFTLQVPPGVNQFAVNQVDDQPWLGALDRPICVTLGKIKLLLSMELCMKKAHISTIIATTAASAAAVLIASPAQAGDDLLIISRDRPTLDRWMYPFNQTPGYRPGGSLFGYWSTNSADGFDNRDAQIVLGFSVTEDISPEDLEGMEVVSATVTIQISNDSIFYDDTTDDWRCFLDPEDSEYVPDEDINQPMELTGVGYRGGFTNTTWFEEAPFALGNPAAPGVRSAYAMVYRDGVETDCSNSLREEWNPEPFAVGIVDGLTPGEPVPVDSTFTFNVNVEDENIQGYVMGQLEEGRVSFCLNSMKQAFQDGGNFPIFYLKENAAVEFGIASAATLEIILGPEADDTPCGDLDGDGIVGGADLTKLLGGWNSNDPELDLTGDGFVGGADLTVLLGCWTSS